MSIFFYNIAIRCYRILVGLAALFSTKARDWVRGRKNQHITNLSLSAVKIVWFHCASVGEFEQARPIIEYLKKKDATINIVLTFFSPSGYNLRIDYPYVDHVYYLPLDTKTNASKFLSKINPDLIIFVKYEFWYHYINEAHQRKIPLFLISGIFRKNQLFFKPYGGLFRHLLSNISKIYLQDKASFSLLKSIGITNIIVNGDTRFDRVNTIKNQDFNDQIIEEFIQAEKPTIIFGSTWPQDEKLISKFIKNHKDNYNYIIVPHEIDKQHLDQIKNTFKDGLQVYSTPTNQGLFNVLLIDKMGFLSFIYRYAHIVYIGGGFGKAIHNTLEPAVYRCPIIIGPHYQKFNEANQMIEQKAMVSVNNYESFSQAILELNDSKLYKERVKNIDSYLINNLGATQLILKDIEKILDKDDK